jgi:iron complex outermembrane receptor protein
MPGIEELFTEGPHLPAYSFEVGNPDLNEELGHGVEWSVRFATDKIGFQNSWYLTDFSNYLYPRNTGELSVRRPLPVYQITGDKAQLWGTEFLMEVELSKSVSMDATLSYVEGRLTKADTPLPFIPPLAGKVDVQYTLRGLTVGGSVRFASRQDRLGEFEEPTQAYQVYDLITQYIIHRGMFLHTISLIGENITDATYRMHLSRVKSIMPEPGRNVKLLYRVYF